ncbi:hypothetical protein SCYAM73S_08196 [Streptomyces cyaneofuscatus]
MRLARFGVNGDFAYNLLRRLDPVVADPPDVITVLIGTNDARASLPGHPVERTMKRKHLPERPSADWFQQCLGAVVERLRTRDRSRRSVCCRSRSSGNNSTERRRRHRRRTAD